MENASLDKMLVNYGDGPTAIFDHLKVRIVRGELAQGSELKIGPLAAELGVSIVPLREAVRMLSAEGLIEMRPRRSPIIARLDSGVLIEINNIRAALEPMVLRDAIPRHTPVSIERCRNLVAIDRPELDLSKRVELNKQFHISLLEPSTMRHTLEIIDAQYLGLARTVHSMVMSEPGLIEEHEPEHEAILEAVIAQDGEKAENLLRGHIGKATERARLVINSEPGTKTNSRQSRAVDLRSD